MHSEFEKIDQIKNDHEALLKRISEIEKFTFFARACAVIVILLSCYCYQKFGVKLWILLLLGAQGYICWVAESKLRKTMMRCRECISNLVIQPSTPGSA